MKYEVTSLHTKKALAASLKKLVSQKPFSKITVREIIEDCGVNRKTFYYHFADVYALLQWTLEQEAVDVVKKFDLLAEYEEAILFVLDYIDANSSFLKNICRSVARDQLKWFFYQDFSGVTRSVVDRSEDVQGLKIPEDFKNFLAAFYTEALAGCILEWVENGSPLLSREKVVLYLSTIIRSAIPCTLRDFPSLLPDPVTPA